MAIRSRLANIGRILVVIGACGIWLGSHQIPGKPQSQPVAVVGATIHTMSGPPLERGTLLFNQGKIAAIGKGIAIPRDARVIPARGLHIYPGLISAETRLGLVEIGAVRATRDYAETGDINPNVRAEIAINPDSELIPVTRANGIALAHSVPEGGLLSGTSAVIMLDGWTWEEMILKAPVGLHIQWPEPPPTAPNSRPYPVTEKRSEREQRLERIKEAFHEARTYMNAKAAEPAEGTYHNTDSRWEAMVPVLKRDIPVFIHAHHWRQIDEAIHWAAEENLRAVLVGGYDAWRSADLLKRYNVPVIIGGIHNLPLRGDEKYDEWFVLPARLRELGVKFCISDGGGAFIAPMARNLPYHAGTAVAYGLPHEEALKALTIYCAEILGIADRVGSLEVGKDATLIVTDGDPLEITTKVLRMFIQGREVDLSSKHTSLYEKYREKYRRLRLYRGP
ncbi:MAG: amidohydrolase family protein [bacterium JZ-2024 1]